MKATLLRRRPLLGAALLLALLLGLGYAFRTHWHGAHGHGHVHDEHGAGPLTLDHGRRWATDAPLRAGMERLRAAVAPHQNNPPVPAAARLLADTVEAEVRFLFANCRLSPKADAVLHVLINELMEGAALVVKPGSVAAGVAKLTHVLHEYPRYFDHPGWPEPAGAAP